MTLLQITGSNIFSGTYDIFVNCNWVVTRWQYYSTYLHTDNTQNNTNNNRTKQLTTNLEEGGPCPVFANFTLAFALKLRKKHGKNLSQGSRRHDEGTVHKHTVRIHSHNNKNT